MKVGTDGILLGCWANVENKSNALDIGAGTGLISLMLKQRGGKALTVTGVEIDDDAFIQASQNVALSPWQITLFHQDIQSFKVTKRFDLIVSNPPYFENSLKSKTLQKQTARHTDSLSFFELTTQVAHLLSDDGEFAVVLPYVAKEVFITVADKAGLQLLRQCEVRSKANKLPIRVLMGFALKKKDVVTGVVQANLVIHQADGQYSTEYKTLCRDFYLKF